MSFNTYVINLDSDTEKWNLMQSRLQAHHINPIRFSAIDGRDPEMFQKYKYKISTFAEYFCPKIPIAIALSHLLLIEHIYNNDKNEYALVLEDDSVPAVENVYMGIENVLSNIPSPQWDIIKLYYFFYTNMKKKSYKNYTFTCSASAYLISRKAIEQLLHEKVYYHYDFQMNFTKLRIYKSPTHIFKTYELDSSSNRTNNSITKVFKHIPLPMIDTPNDQGLYFWFNFKAIRLCGIELSVFELIVLLIIIVIIIRK